MNQQTVKNFKLSLEKFFHRNLADKSELISIEISARSHFQIFLFFETWLPTAPFFLSKTVFKKYDEDRSGNFNSYELRLALNACGETSKLLDSFSLQAHCLLSDFLLWQALKSAIKCSTLWLCGTAPRKASSSLTITSSAVFGWRQCSRRSELKTRITGATPSSIKTRWVPLGFSFTFIRAPRLTTLKLSGFFHPAD